MKRAVYLLVAVLFITAAAFGQAVAGLGAVGGAVRDASGAVVPNATVVITNESKGITRTIQTTDAGIFAAPALVPASGYAISVTRDGFSKWEAKNFEILVGQTVDFNITLQVGATATTVEVTGEAPLVETSKTGVSQVVEKAQIENLPINGRRADTFVLLTPAVTSDGAFGLVSFRGTAGGNAFLTDGNDTTQSFYNENAGRTRISTQISQDAVQEFQVLSNGFSAEFGRAMGGVINTVTRSGTNEYHGAGYWYFRNRSLNATDRYANHINGPEWRHQAGGSIGGPIKQDKVFFFANTELVKRNFPGMNRFINSNFAPTGTLLRSSCTATQAQCDAAFNFISKQMDRLIDRNVNSIMGFAKVDWRPNENDSFSFDANVMHWRSLHGIQTQTVLSNGNMIGNNGNSTVETRYGKASWTRILSPAVVNDFRFGWFKDRLSDPGASDLWPSTGALGLTINGANVGAAQAYPRTYPSEQRFQFVDNLSWTRGAHAFKFGFDYATTQDWLNQLYNGAGSYSYSNITAFAKDFTDNLTGLKNYSTFTQQFGNPIVNMRTSDVNAYIQDTWKPTANLTVNYGVRYEKTFIPQPTISDPNYDQTSRINSPSKNFAPRVSLSYSLNDKTVIRAGYGIYFARFNGNGLSSFIVTGNGKYQTSIQASSTTAGAPVFPFVLPSASAVPAGTTNLTFAAPGLRSPYTQQGTFAIERQLSKDLGLTVNYIWSRGIALFTSRDVNLADPTRTATYTVLDASGNTAGVYTTPVYTAKIDSRYGHIYQVENSGQSWYNGLAVQLRKRMSHGLSGQVSYTWSHAIDNARQSGGDTVVAWTQKSTFNGDVNFDKGSSGLDQRHRAVVNFTWEPTITKSNSFLAKYLVNGWQVSALTTMASAQAATATVSVSGQQFTSQGITMLYASSTGAINGSDGWSRVPFWPVSSIDIDRIYRVDARLSRTLPISEGVKAYLMFEAFNAFNTQYNSGVNTNAFTASGGVLKPVATLGIGTASQAFPDGTNARRMQVAARITF